MEICCNLKNGAEVYGLTHIKITHRCNNCERYDNTITEDKLGIPTKKICDNCNKLSDQRCSYRCECCNFHSYDSCVFINHFSQEQHLNYVDKDLEFMKLNEKSLKKELQNLKSKFNLLKNKLNSINKLSNISIIE